LEYLHAPLAFAMTVPCCMTGLASLFRSRSVSLI
jgi:hypothetical protein